MPHTIRALLFDLDDTLYSRNAAFRKWAQEFVQHELGLAEDDPRCQEAVKQIIDLDEWGYSPRDTLFRKIKETHQPLLQKGVGQLIEAFHRRFPDHMYMEEETRYLLTALKGAGLPFGIITNGPTSTQLRRVCVLGLDQLTSCIFVSEQFGCAKPDSAIFLAAAACLGYEPADILFIGDHPRNDMWGARQVGMHTAWLHHQRVWPVEIAEIEPDYVIGVLGELHGLLDIPSFEL